MGVDLAGLPVWVEAFGTVGALGAALIQIQRERSWRHRRDAEERDDRRTEQARLISAWLDQTTPSPVGADPHFVYTTVALRNGAPDPVYSLLVALVGIQGAVPHRG